MKKAILRGMFLLALGACLLAGCAGRQTRDPDLPSVPKDVQANLDQLQTTVQDTQTTREDGAKVQSSVSTTQCDDGTRIVSTQSSVTYPNGDTEEIKRDETWQADGSGEIDETGLRKRADGGTVQTTLHTTVYAGGARITRQSVLTAAADGAKDCVETITMTDEAGKESTETTRYQIDAQGNILPQD